MFEEDKTSFKDLSNESISKFMGESEKAIDYRNSWNELTPVIDRINKISANDLDDYLCAFRDRINLRYNISKIYPWVVQFVSEYNEMNNRLKLSVTNKHILLAWYSAHKQAANNSELMILNAELFTVLCGERMDVCGVADRLLYSLSLNVSYPAPMLRHLLAEKNKACMSCQISSNIEANHPECQEKNKEWFESKRELFKFAKEIRD
jgi:hypothetical protein